MIWIQPAIFILSSAIAFGFDLGSGKALVESHGDSHWEAVKKSYFIRNKDSGVVHMPRSCEDVQSENVEGTETKLYTGEVRMGFGGFRLVERNVICNRNGQPTEKMTLSTTTYPRDCMDILWDNPWAPSGVYQVFHPDFSYHDYLIPISVYCDMDSHDGGWTIFQRRQDGSVNFEQHWIEFENGFGSVAGEYWLGLRFVNMLTLGREQSLFIRMRARNDPSYWSYAMYDNFTIADSSDNYRIGLGQFTGNDTNGDGMNRLSGMPFSAIGRSNDGGRGCVSHHRGAFWHNFCTSANLNGLYHSNQTPTFICWGLCHTNFPVNVKSFVTMAFKPIEKC